MHRAVGILHRYSSVTYSLYALSSFRALRRNEAHTRIHEERRMVHVHVHVEGRKEGMKGRGGDKRREMLLKTEATITSILHACIYMIVVFEISDTDL